MILTPDSTFAPSGGAQAHRGAGSTETAARDRIAPKAGQLRGRVLALVAEAGDDGLTATEAYALYVEAFGEPRGGLYSISPRLSELERAGYAQKGEQVRDRRQAYTATADGIAWAGAQR
jgi:DNA-binding PadR family transcriptional regulator